MAQKSAPAALRLQTNKHFDAFWFADRLYGFLFHQTVQSKGFLHALFQKLGTKTALSHVQATPHGFFIQSFFCAPRHMNQRMKYVQVPFKANTAYLPPFAAFMQTPHMHVFASCMGMHAKQWTPFVQSSAMHVLLALHQTHRHKNYASQMQNVHHVMYALSKSQTRAFPDAQKQATQTTRRFVKQHGKLVEKKAKGQRPTIHKYARHIESVLSTYLHKKVVWQPYKMARVFTSATFVAHYIALQFEQNRKKPFRFIFQDVIKQCILTPQIVGIRIAVAGCIGGADKARVETTKYGQTSLHVFSHRIDYHATAASTRKGLLGIKVWMSFKTAH